MFSFFKKKAKGIEPPENSVKSELELTPHEVDDLLIIRLPAEFIPLESDRFRAVTEDRKKIISITNHQKPYEGESLNKKFYGDLKLKLYERFVNEGGYEAYDDLKVTDKFIRRSFKVDDETQYYFTGARIIGGDIIITDFIVREFGGYNGSIMPMLETVNDLIEH